MSPEKIYVVPAQGLTVRDPVTRAVLPPEGDWKPRDTYWERRLNDGDVKEGKPPAAAQPAKSRKE
jgi:hypothetical protein